MTITNISEVDGKTVVYFDLSDFEREKLKQTSFGENEDRGGRQKLEKERHHIFDTLLPDYHQLVSDLPIDFDDQEQDFGKIISEDDKKGVKVELKVSLLGKDRENSCLYPLHNFFSSAYQSCGALLQASISEVVRDSVSGGEREWYYSHDLRVNTEKSYHHHVCEKVLTALLTQQTVAEVSQRYREHTEPFLIASGIGLYLFNPTAERVTTAANEFLRFKDYVREQEEAVHDAVALLVIRNIMLDQEGSTSGAGQKFIQQQAEEYLQKADHLIAEHIPRQNFSLLAGMTLKETNTGFWHSPKSAA